MRVAFAKATHIFSAKIIALYAVFNDQCFNDTLTNDYVSFEQLGPGFEFGRIYSFSTSKVKETLFKAVIP